MRRESIDFFVSDNGVWLVDHVPARYLRRID
jgi:RNA:NAD 2'-phosphotransferase (TPT1/KptA family)